jgi:hypothetical protein
VIYPTNEPPTIKEAAMAKQRIRAELRTVTLGQVYDLAKWDEVFLGAVLTNPKEALAAEGCKLTPADLKALEEWLKKVQRITGRDLLLLLLEPVRGKTYPWP